MNCRTICDCQELSREAVPYHSSGKHQSILLLPGIKIRHFTPELRGGSGDFLRTTYNRAGAFSTARFAAVENWMLTCLPVEVMMRIHIGNTSRPYRLLISYDYRHIKLKRDNCRKRCGLLFLFRFINSFETFILSEYRRTK